MKVVINDCFGGFSLSHEAVMAYADAAGITLYPEEEGALKIIHYFKVPVDQYRALEADVRANDPDYKRLNEQDWYFSESDIARDDQILVEVVERLGKKASGRFGNLKVVEIPDGIEWEIEEYDGLEHVAESHRVWR